MSELQRVRADHASAILAFELANRAYFAASISDRGDDYFDQFTERHNALLAEQEAGLCAYYVLAGDDGSVLGRFNLFDIQDGRLCSAIGSRSTSPAAALRRRPSGKVPASGGATRAAHAQGGGQPRQCRVPEGADQGRIRPSRPCRTGRPARHLVSRALAVG